MGSFRAYKRVSSTVSKRAAQVQLKRVNEGVVWRLSWPIILANMSVPLVGLVDTAVMGHSGSRTDLGAIAFGSLVFNLLYWSLGFLRMGTTGLTAQADGQCDINEVRVILARTLILAMGLGLLLLVGQQAVTALALYLLNGSDTVESLTSAYILARLWGAPASLALFALLGVLIGLGHSGLLLRIQLLLNGMNIFLDVLLAVGFGWGIVGIGIGSAIAEWLAFLYAAWILFHRLGLGVANGAVSWARIFYWQPLRQMLTMNIDILLRTVMLLFGFAWFIDRSASYGDVVLAANHLLLQLITVSAFFLDGYAHATETLVGRSIGRRDHLLFTSALWASSRLALVTAIALALLTLFGGAAALQLLTDLPQVIVSAEACLPYTAVYILLAVAAFQLDGIFIGASCGRALRNASAVSLSVFLASAYLLESYFENNGLWLAMIVFVLARAFALACYLPTLRSAFQ